MKTFKFLFRKHILLPLFTLFFLSACANQFAYNTLPFWIDYYLSDYVDMSPTQQAQFDRDLEAFHQWHRNEELPKIQKVLNQLNVEMAKPLSYGKIGEYHEKVKALTLASLQGLTPTLVNLISSLSDEQADAWLNTLNSKIEERVEKARKGTEQEQIKRRQDRLIDQAEEWVDNLSDKQQAQLLEMAGYQIEMRAVFTAIRDSLVDELSGVLENRHAPDLDVRINNYLANLVAFRSLEYQNDMALYLARRYELLQRLDRNLSQKQRAALRGKLQEYSDDITAVMN